MANDVVLTPMAVSCFTLRENCCDEKNHYKIGPITQPKSVFTPHPVMTPRVDTNSPVAAVTRLCA